MIVGDPNTFAIESEITLAYEEPNQMALGFFVLHVMGRCYGVRNKDATILADPFYEVGRRIARRRGHRPVWRMNAAAADIASSFRRAIYDECDEGELFFGMPAHQFGKAISANHIEWSAACDEAFDDSGYVLQFEDEDSVRLVAFAGASDFLYDPDSLVDRSLSPDAFYEILQEWHDRFKSEWSSWSKVSKVIH
jgi:hypothetical protein